MLKSLAPYRNLDNWIVGTLDNFWPNPKTTDVFDVDIEETENEVILKADLPGVAKEDLIVNVDDGVVTISCERKQVKTSNLRQERFFGKWERSFRMDEIDPERYEAVLKDGVLTLKFEKQKSKKCRKIEVKTG